jgi:hypothetical protein
MSVSQAWDTADQEQRNAIAKTLFEEILVEDRKVVAVKPRRDLEPFFELNVECHSKDIAGDPDGLPGRNCQLRRTRSRWRLQSLTALLAELQEAVGAEGRMRKHRVVSPCSARSTQR